MSDDDGRAAAFEARLRSAIVGCGVDDAAIFLQYSDIIQDYDLVINSGPLSAACISSIEAVVDYSATLSFADSANAAELLAQQTRRVRTLLREKAESMFGLPRFDRDVMTLAAFARELEAYCGFEPGEGLKTTSETTLAVNSDLWAHPGGVLRMGRLIEVTYAALVDHDDIRFVVTGGA